MKTRVMEEGEVKWRILGFEALVVAPGTAGILKPVE